MLSLQHIAGNRAAGLLVRRALPAVQPALPVLQPAPPTLVQRKDTDPPAAPDEALIAATVEHLGRSPAVAGALELFKGDVTKLKDSIIKLRGIDEPLKTQLAALDRKGRAALADAVIARLQLQVGQQRAAEIARLADQFEQRIKTRLPELAELARLAEENEPPNLKASERRPQFPLILKFICLRLLFAQIKQPQTKARKLGKDYGGPLGLAVDDPIFPDIYEEAFVAELKRLPPEDGKNKSTIKAELREAVASKALTILSTYIAQRIGVTPDTIRAEYGTLAVPAKRNIEGGLAGYFACRLGLLHEFGSPANVPATMAKIKNYYEDLVEAKFLQQGPGRKPGGAGTLVHREMKEALDRAEELIYDPANSWQAEVLASVRKYWSTNIRENRNSPTRLSEHSFGMAIDINPESNPNLARFGQANWQYVNALVGEDIFYDARGNPTEAVAVIRKAGGLSDPDEIMAAIEKINASSGQLVGVFDSEANLRARLAEYLRARGVSPGVFLDEAEEQMRALLDHAQQAATGPKKERAAHAKQLQEIIAYELWERNAPAPIDVPPLGERLVKALARSVKTADQLDEREYTIMHQIESPATKPPRDAARLGLRALYEAKMVRELEAVPADERAELARQVVGHLRQMLARKQAGAQALEVAAFVMRGFSLFQATRTSKGGKIGSGKQPPNVASQGFANLSDKLVKALVLPQGGNLIWLGVHNQDMHHFELKTKPPIPKADVPAGTPPPVPKPGAGP